MDFSKYTELTLENVKAARESFYNILPGSCDILVGSVFSQNKFKGKKSSM